MSLSASEYKEFCYLAYPTFFHLLDLEEICWHFSASIYQSFGRFLAKHKYARTTFIKDWFLMLLVLFFSVTEFLNSRLPRLWASYEY